VRLFFDNKTLLVIYTIKGSFLITIIYDVVSMKEGLITPELADEDTGMIRFHHVRATGACICDTYTRTHTHASQQA
jgi:hypothetical protein